MARNTYSAPTACETFGLRDVSVLIPIHDDRPNLVAILEILKQYSDLEIVVIDSRSSDNPGEVSSGVEFVVSPHFGRGSQLAYGFDLTARAWIWMLHADSTLTSTHVEHLNAAISKCSWGRFDIHLVGTRFIYRVIERMMNWRSALTGICTGDQGIFVRRKLVCEIGGVPEQMLMEDIELSKRLRGFGRPLRIRTPLGASVRKWETEGVASTIFKMWCYRLRYFLGASPDDLHRDYYGSNRSK